MSPPFLKQQPCVACASLSNNLAPPLLLQCHKAKNLIGGNGEPAGGTALHCSCIRPMCCAHCQGAGNLVALLLVLYRVKHVVLCQGALL